MHIQGKTKIHIHTKTSSMANSDLKVGPVAKLCHPTYSTINQELDVRPPQHHIHSQENLVLAHPQRSPSLPSENDRTRRKSTAAFGICQPPHLPCAYTLYIAVL